MNLERISDALQNYTGREDSMHQVVVVLEEELGENWTQTVFQDLQSLPPALQNNLNNVFNYYAATMAWNETQTYLTDPNLQRTSEIEERLPILKHWLDFFGAPGQEAYQQLEARLAQTTSDAAEDVDVSPEESVDETEEAVSEPVDELDQPQEEAVEDHEEILENQGGLEESVSEEPLAEQEVSDEEVIEDQRELIEDGDNKLGEDSETEFEAGEEKSENEENPGDEEDLSGIENNPAYFEIQKVFNQLSLLEQNQAWLSARCIQLKNIEVYAYPFYGFIVDLMRQILKDMEAIEEDEEKLALLDMAFEGGTEAFAHKKEAILHEIELAEQNCESAVTALISEDMDMEEVRRTLGNIDESDTVEYVGPAPDGFELLDDNEPLDEAAIKKQYEKLENVDALTGQENVSMQTNVPEEKNNTSQNEQKGVQRKLSFSLKKKKTTDGDA